MKTKSVFNLSREWRRRVCRLPAGLSVSRERERVMRRPCRCRLGEVVWSTSRSGTAQPYTHSNRGAMPLPRHPAERRLPPRFLSQLMSYSIYTDRSSSLRWDDSPWSWTRSLCRNTKPQAHKGCECQFFFFFLKDCECQFSARIVCIIKLVFPIRTYMYHRFHLFTVSNL